MHPSMKRRTLGALAVLLASQTLSACVVVPARPRAVVVQPGYGYSAPVHHHHHHRHPHWRR